MLLAQRLLAVTDGDYDKEVSPLDIHLDISLTIHFQRRNIEILKIRFGEIALQVCEVMLKDMSDSRRTDQHVQQHSSVSMSWFRCRRRSYITV